MKNYYLVYRLRGGKKTLLGSTWGDGSRDACRRFVCSFAEDGVVVRLAELLAVLS